MCIAKNEEALGIDSRFAECYGNMANAWKVSNHYSRGLTALTVKVLGLLFFYAVGGLYMFSRINRFFLYDFDVCRKKETLTLPFSTTWLPLMSVCNSGPILDL